MLATFEKLLDRCIQLATLINQRHTQAEKEGLDQIYLEIAEVHKTYVAIIDEALTTNDRGELKDAVSLLQRRKFLTDWDRDRLRAKAVTSLSAFPQWEAFYNAILNYLCGPTSFGYTYSRNPMLSSVLRPLLADLIELDGLDPPDMWSEKDRARVEKQLRSDWSDRVAERATLAELWYCQIKDKREVAHRLLLAMARKTNRAHGEVVELYYQCKHNSSDSLVNLTPRDEIFRLYNI
jgi:hypothetical protein